MSSSFGAPRAGLVGALSPRAQEPAQGRTLLETWAAMHARENELAAVMSTGRSIVRWLRRLMAVGFVLWAASLYAQPLMHMTGGYTKAQIPKPPAGKTTLTSKIAKGPLPTHWQHYAVPNVQQVLDNRFGKALVEGYVCDKKQCGMASRLILLRFAMPISGAASPNEQAQHLVNDLVNDLARVDAVAAAGRVVKITRRQADGTRVTEDIAVPGWNRAYAGNLWRAVYAVRTGEIKLAILQVADHRADWAERAVALVEQVLPPANPAVDKVLD